MAPVVVLGDVAWTGITLARERALLGRAATRASVGCGHARQTGVGAGWERLDIKFIIDKNYVFNKLFDFYHTYK